MEYKLKNKITIFAILITVFSVSYFLTQLYLEDKIMTNSEKISNLENEEYLKEDIKVSLNKRAINEEEKTLKDLKKELGIKNDLTEEELSDLLVKDGYNLTQECTNKLYYTRTVAPNKYYIREYNGYLAIFKSDNKCKLKIEDENTDVFNRKKFENLTEKDRESINNFEREFNTKEEAEEAISELIS